jgi:hypothetical protein
MLTVVCRPSEWALLLVFLVGSGVAAAAIVLWALVDDWWEDRHEEDAT